MRIAFLTQYYPPEIGAPQNRISHLAARFADRGHEVFVLTAMPNYPTGKIFPGYGGVLRRQRLANVRIIRSCIYPTQGTGFVKRLTNYFSFMVSSALAGTAFLPRTDYLFVESPPLFLGLTGYILSRFKTSRLIFNVSDLWPESAVRLGVLKSEGLVYRMGEWLEGFCYRHAWLVTGQSKSILSDIAGRFSGVPTYHLSNGVEVHRFGADRRTEHASRVLKSGAQCVALYAGLHGLAQGLDQVLQAARHLDGKGPRFVFVGDGPEKRALQDLAIRERIANVSFLDPVPAAEMPALVATADIVLVVLKTYIPGAVPSKLYEAMASGRPIVLVAAGEAADIVRDHQAGFVVPPGDIEGIADALQHLSRSPSLRAEMGANGRRAAEQYYDRAKIAEGFIEHLTKNLGPAAPVVTA